MFASVKNSLFLSHHYSIKLNNAMKYKPFFYGLLLGGLLVFAVMRAVKHGEINSGHHAIAVNWAWPESLDAIKAAPLSHKILYEDSNTRILYVTVNPGALEPVHTHRWKSLAWAVKNPPFTLYHYKIDHNRLLVGDSFTTQLPINKVNAWGPEQPHSIRNNGKDTLILYRIEFKH